MSTLKLTAASGGGTVALKGPATTTSNAALELTVPGVESGELVTKDSDNNLVNIQGINGGQIGHRNLIINGAMQVAQRGTSGAWAANGYLTVDRWHHTINNSAGRFTSKQTADSPDGLGGKCLELDVTTADTSIAANEHVVLAYRFEGQDVQRLAKGTAGAKNFTLSFYVKGNGNATYMCEIFDRTNTRVIQQQFSVTSSWSRVTLTFNNETSNGTLNNDNSHELDIQLWLHAGSDFTSGTYTANTWGAKVNANRAVGISSLFSSTDNYFRITGVQLEVGDYATSYEFKTYQQELAACMRYYETHNHLTTAKTTDGSITSQWSTITSNDSNTLVVSTGIVYKVPKRAWPTITLYNPGDTSTAARVNAQGTERTVTASYGGANALTRIYVSGASSGNYVTYNWEADAEL